MERSNAIAFGRLVTSRGKTYVPVGVVVPEGGSVRVNARTTGGHPVPAKLLTPWGHEERVLVVPALLATIRASVLVRDASGAVVDRGVYMVRPSASFLVTKLNHVRHGSELLWYEGLDEKPCGDATYVDLEHVYSDFEATDVLRGTIEFTGSDPDALKRPFELLLIDAYGRVIKGARFVMNRDALSRQSDGTYLREVRFAQAISRDVRSLTLWVRHPDHRIPDGFLSLDAPTLALHRNADIWKRDDRADGERYHEWYVINGRASALDLELERHRPLKTQVSLLIDLHDFDPFGFEETLRSLENQTHGAWELIGYGDVASDGVNRWQGPQWQAEEGAVELALGLPPATPAEALSEATGAYVGVIGVGDTLEPDALHRLCEALDAADPAAPPAMAFADQDLRFDGDEGHGHFVDGFLKTEFDRDQLYTVGATGRPALVARECLGVDGIAAREATGLAFDLELALAAVEADRAIVHVPRVLYHGRAEQGKNLHTETAPALGSEADSQCQAVLESHLDRVSLAATVRADRNAGWGRIVDYEPVGEPLVSIIIPNKDSVPVLRRCLESIFAKSTYHHFEIIIVENNSTEPETFAFYGALEGMEQVRVIRYEGPFNFSAICNLGVREARGGHLLFLNNDTEVLEPRWLELLLGPLMRHEVGAVGARLLYPDTLIQHGGVLIQAEGPLHLELFEPPTYDSYEGLTRYHTRESTAVTGACLMVPRRVFDEVGGFDERLPLAYNDVQLCVSIRDAGYSIVYEPRATLHHYESYSRGLDFDDRAKEVRLVSEIGETMLRWTELYAKGDPFYDHRFGYHNNYFALGWRPSLHPEED